MAEVLDWRHTGPANGLVGRAAQVLADGEVVLSPTESAYVAAACALIPEAIGRLGSADAPLRLALRDAEDVRDWVPEISLVGQRLAKRCWPGPVEMVWGAEARTGLASRLPQPV